MSSFENNSTKRKVSEPIEDNSTPTTNKKPKTTTIPEMNLLHRPVSPSFTADDWIKWSNEHEVHYNELKKQDGWNFLSYFDQRNAAWVYAAPSKCKLVFDVIQEDGTKLKLEVEVHRDQTLRSIITKLLNNTHHNQVFSKNKYYFYSWSVNNCYLPEECIFLIQPGDEADVAVLADLTCAQLLFKPMVESLKEETRTFFRDGLWCHKVRVSPLKPGKVRINFPFLKPLPQGWQQNLFGECHVPPLTEEYDAVAWREFRDKTKFPSSCCGEVLEINQKFEAMRLSCPNKISVQFHGVLGTSTHLIAADDFLLHGLEAHCQEFNLQVEDIMIKHGRDSEYTAVTITPRDLFTGKEPPLEIQVSFWDLDRQTHELYAKHGELELPENHKRIRYLCDINDPSYILSSEDWERMGTLVDAAAKKFEGFETGNGWFLMLKELKQLVCEIAKESKPTCDSFTSMLMHMHLWECWRMDSHGKMVFYKECCRTSTISLIRHLDIKLSELVSLWKTEKLDSTKSYLQLERLVTRLNNEWDSFSAREDGNCFHNTLMAFEDEGLEAKKQPSIVKPTEEQLVAMVQEAKTYWLLQGTEYPDETIRKIVEGLQLEFISIHQEEIEDERWTEEECKREVLELKFSIPRKDCADDDEIERKQYAWAVDWCDLDEFDNDLHPLLAGRIFCYPFVADPPFTNRISRDCALKKNKNRSEAETKKAIERILAKADQEASKIRKHWNLQKCTGLPDTCRSWLHGCGLKPKAMKWQDVARCVCAGVGVLARSSPDNSSSSWVFKRFMLRLEKELKTWDNPNASDPNEMEETEKVRRFGGCLGPKYLEALKREERWGRRQRN